MLLRNSIPRRTLGVASLARQSLLAARGAGVTNVSPVAEFTHVVTLLSVAFTDTSSDADGAIVAWDWDYGDGTTHGTTQNPTHAYTTIGAKTVRLTVMDSGGATHYVEHTVTPTLAKDGPSNWYVPVSAGDFTALGLAVPDYLWLCQEASGNLSSTIGSLTLTANATGHLYEQTHSGWTRKFVQVGAVSGSSWRTTDAALDLAAGESYAMLVLSAIVTPSGTSVTWFAPQGSNDRLQTTATTATLRSNHNTVVATGTVDQGTNVHYAVWYRNNAASASGAITDTDAVVGTHNTSARTGVVRAIGNEAASLPRTAKFGLVAIYKGTNAERDWAAYITALRG